MFLKSIILKYKRFDINKHWGEFNCSLEEFGKEASRYWFDKSTYRVLGLYKWLSKRQKLRIDKDNGQRYVVLPQYVAESRYKDLVKELNNPVVTEFFEQADDEENAHFRYRCFVDWNGLNHSEWYRIHLIVRNIVFKWCSDNNIKYLYREETPPPNYIFDGRDLNDIQWNIDWNEIDQNATVKNI